MKKQTSNRKDVLYPPAFPYTGPQLFQGLRVALADSFGFQPGFPRLGRILGEETSLTHYWFRVLPHRHVIGLLTLLERLPEPKRKAWLDQYCPELPRLDSPRLSHDPLAVSNLENLLRSENGITWIQGGTDHHRTFVVTALAHSFTKIRGERGSVSGLDVHEPRKWVPVETVTYFKEPLSMQRLRMAIMEVWSDVLSSDAPMVLLNGIWMTLPELHEAILGLALKRHVLVTVPKLPEGAPAQLTTPSQVVTVFPAREHEEWIRVKVEAI